MSNYRLWGVIATTTLSTLISISPTWAADPFRTTNRHSIGDKTEAAFKAIFQDGDYGKAQGYLKQTQVSESNEPLAYAMKASLAYTLDKDLSSFSLYGNKTLETAQVP